MSEKMSEIDALKAIDSYLDQLTNEQRTWIFNFIMSKYGLSHTNNQHIVKNGSTQAMNNGGSDSSTGEMSIKQFLAMKKPEGFYEQITCLGYYLEKHGGLESFNTKDITIANTDARALKIPNPSMYVNHTQLTYGYLSAVGGGKKALSARGEAVVEALPDRDAVRAALENYPMKKKAAKKKTKDD
ncbi:MAG: hypothetical protein ACXVPQ_08595 [Bacteroidia bacterium]